MNAAADTPSNTKLLKVYVLQTFHGQLEEEESRRSRPNIDPESVGLGDLKWRFEKVPIRIGAFEGNLNNTPPEFPNGRILESRSYWIANSDVSMLDVLVTSYTVEASERLLTCDKDDAILQRFHTWLGDIDISPDIARGSRFSLVFAVHECTEFQEPLNDNRWKTLGGVMASCTRTPLIQSLTAEHSSNRRKQTDITGTAETLMFFHASAAMVRAAQLGARSTCSADLSSDANSAERLLAERRQYLKVSLEFSVDNLSRYLDRDTPLIGYAQRYVGDSDDPGVQTRHREVLQLFQDVTDVLMDERKLQEESSIRLTAERVTIMSIITFASLIATMLQAIDSQEYPIPLFSTASWLRVAMIAVVAALLAIAYRRFDAAKKPRKDAVK